MIIPAYASAPAGGGFGVNSYRLILPADRRRGELIATSGAINDATVVGSGGALFVLSGATQQGLTIAGGTANIWGSLAGNGPVIFSGPGNLNL